MTDEKRLAAIRARVDGSRTYMRKSDLYALAVDDAPWLLDRLAEVTAALDQAKAKWHMFSHAYDVSINRERNTGALLESAEAALARVERLCDECDAGPGWYLDPDTVRAALRGEV